MANVLSYCLILLSFNFCMRYAPSPKEVEILNKDQLIIAASILGIVRIKIQAKGA